LAAEVFNLTAEAVRLTADDHYDDDYRAHGAGGGISGRLGLNPRPLAGTGCPARGLESRALGRSATPAVPPRAAVFNFFCIPPGVGSPQKKERWCGGRDSNSRGIPPGISGLGGRHP